jgi:hypothetical protein
MKIPLKMFLVLFVIIFLSLLSLLGLDRHPIKAFVLKMGETHAEAYQLTLYSGNRETEVLPVTLLTQQRKDAEEILASGDRKYLVEFSNQLGKWSFVAGLPVKGEVWPWYLGGGLKAFEAGPKLTVVDNLNWFDRVYLNFNAKVPESVPSTPAEMTIDDMDKPIKSPTASPTPAALTPSTTVVATVPVRVEIQNGCGITNAAEWAARKLKGNGIVITQTGNADNFHYAKTLVKSRTAVPPAMAEALKRMGIGLESVQTDPKLDSQADLVVIVGMDYLKLRKKKRERIHH